MNEDLGKLLADLPLRRRCEAIEQRFHERVKKRRIRLADLHQCVCRMGNDGRIRIIEKIDETGKQRRILSDPIGH